MMRKQLPFYLLLLPLFALLHNYNDLFGFIPFGMMVVFLLLSYAVAGVVYGIAYLFSKRAQQASLVAFFALLLTLFWGAYHDLVKGITHDGWLSSYKIILPVTLLVLAGAAWWFAKNAKALTKFTSYLNMLLVVLVTIEGGKVIFHLMEVAGTHNLVYPEKTISKEYRSRNLPDSTKPDIYFLVLDEYTNNKTLQELWQFNNDSITNWLTQQGFYIVSDSRANYDLTPVSISSTLNMQYIDAVNADGTISSRQTLQAVKSMSDNETFSILKGEQYEVRYFTPFNNPVEGDDEFHEFGNYPLKKLYNHTLPKRIERDVLWNFFRDDSLAQRSYCAYYEKREAEGRRMIQSIASTADANTNRKPQFVYGHLMITHRPHLYHADGSRRSCGEIGTANNPFYTYTDQVTYANTIIQQLVTHIRANNKRNTIIVIEGDHGFRKFPYSLPTSYHFPNFSALYFPDGNYAALYKTMSPVNTFRGIFNQYFGQKLPMLRDSSILVKDAP